MALEIDAVGWTNGCTDMLYQAEWYADMAYNNTYGVQAISREAFEMAKANYSDTEGCRDQIMKCRELAELHDPGQLSINDTVNSICYNATVFCATYVVGPYLYNSLRSTTDITHLRPDPSPSQHHIAFFNKAWVQQELGVPVNFTANSPTVLSAYMQLETRSKQQA
jgi:carboxypeptidase D